MFSLSSHLLGIISYFYILVKCTSNMENESFTYRTYEEINEFLERAQEEYKDKVTIFTIGHSFEGRAIKGMKISKMRNGTKGAILLDAGIHAREWIGPVVVVHTVQQLLSNKTHSNLTEALDWYILPILNPDGYIYSMDMNGDRLWRKNRSPTGMPFCQGVDLNRNFDFYWGGPGSSDDPCNLSYRGPFPFSEPEAQAFAQFLLSIRDQLKLYLTLHSAAKAIIYPWGYTDLVPADWMDLESLAMKAEEAMSRVNGTRYMIGPTTHIVGAGAGGSDDWAKGAAGIKYVYTLELPGPQYPHDGFHPPLEDLPIISKEGFQAIRIFAEEIL